MRESLIYRKEDLYWYMGDFEGYLFSLGVTGNAQALKGSSEGLQGDLRKGGVTRDFFAKHDMHRALGGEPGCVGLDADPILNLGIQCLYRKNSKYCFPHFK